MKNKKIITVTVTLFILLFIVGIFIIKNANRGERFGKISADAKVSLTINTDKYRYAPGEEVYIQMASLDTNGTVLCNSNLELTATLKSLSEPETPQAGGQIPNTKYQIPISPSPTCDPAGLAGNSPDYTAFFRANEEGTYRLTLTNKGNDQQVWTEIYIDSAPPEIDIVRWSATRIDLVEKPRYPMVITLTSENGFTGTITDSLPEGFDFAWYGTAEIDDIDGSKTITWLIDLKAGESTELKYEYIPAGSENMTTVIGPVVYSEGSKTYKVSEWKITTGGSLK